VKFSELNKEQKQLLVLAVGGVITLFMIVFNLMIVPAREAAEQGRRHTERYEMDVNRGEALLRRDRRTREEAREAANAMLEIYREHLPPEAGRYIWALERISQIGEDLNLQLVVREHPGSRYIPVRDMNRFDPNSVSMWIPYAVDVEMRTSFANLQNFLRELHTRYPFCSVGSLRITASSENPLHHEVRLLLEWPVFRFQEDLNELEAL